MRRTTHHCDHCHKKAPAAAGALASSLYPALHEDWLELSAGQYSILVSDLALCPECATEPLIVFQVIRTRLDSLLLKRSALERISTGDVTSEA